MTKTKTSSTLLLAVLSLLTVACSGGDGSPSSPARPGVRRPPMPWPAPSADPDPTDPDPDPTASPAPGPASEVRFVALGDTGQANSGQYGVAAAIDAKCEKDGCDFAILLGDNFYSSGVSSATDPQWGPKMEDPYLPIGIPFYAVLGNHDYGGGSGDDPTQGPHQIEYSALNPWFVMPAEWYVFDQGPVTFLATGTNPLARSWSGALASQRELFSETIAASNAPWKISLGHHPYISNGPHGNAGNYDGSSGRGRDVKALYDEALCGEVDVHFSGHDHSLQVLPGPASCPGLFVVSGAGASVTTLPGSNPAEFESTTLGFTYVVATESSLKLEMIARDGRTLYTRTITK